MYKADYDKYLIANIHFNMIALIAVLDDHYSMIPTSNQYVNSSHTNPFQGIAIPSRRSPYGCQPAGDRATQATRLLQAR
jgi:hypothetical protein